MPLSRVPSSFTGTTSIASPSANTIRFTTASTTRSQFDNQGNFSVGNFTAPQNTTVKTWSNADFTRSGQSGSYNLNLYYSTSNNRWEYAGTGHGATFVDSGSGNFTIQSTASSGTIGESASSLAQRIVFGSNGLVTLPSGQLKFPASQNASADANTLDDYEEGTFGANLRVGTTVQAEGSGNYTKIGRMVFFNIVFYNETWTRSGTGSVNISGLPFTAPSSDLLNFAASGAGAFAGYKFQLPNDTQWLIGAPNATLYAGGGPVAHTSIPSSGFLFEQVSGWYITT
jgi:hypothetical protein